MDHVNRLFISAHLTALDAAHAVAARRERADDDRGEGVISAAIAVLIMASIGAAMFAAYKALFDHTSVSVNAKVNQIGQ